MDISCLMTGHHALHSSKGLVALACVFLCQDLLTEDWAHRMSCAVKPSFSLFSNFVSFGKVDSRKTSLGLNV